jgi:transposase, IS6 family
VVNSEGNTLEFLLNVTRDAEAAERFFLNALGSSHTIKPRVITVDKNAVYPKAFKELKEEGAIRQASELQQVKYLNNIVKQDHQFIKRLVKPGLGFFSFVSAWQTLQRYEIMNMIRKGQMQGVNKGDITGQIVFASATLKWDYPRKVAMSRFMLSLFLN